MSGGTDKVRYYTSLSYNNSPGIAKGSQSERFTGLGKLWVKINNVFDAELKLDLGTTTNDGYSDGVNPYSYAYNTSRAFSPYDENGDYYYYVREGTQYPIGYNIFNELEQTGESSTTDRFGGVFNLNAHIIPGLIYTGTVSYYWQNNRVKDWATDRSYAVARIRGYDYGAYGSEDAEYQRSALPVGGTYRDNHTSSRTYTVRNTLNYIQRFRDRHDVNLFGGVEIRSDKYEGISSFNYGYDPLYGQSFSPVYTEDYLDRVSTGMFLPVLTDKLTQVASFFGSASYTFDDRYVLNANIRSDGSNKFGSNPKYRWLPTYSFAGKWIISNEKFMQNADWVDHLSVRASYGIQGNIQDAATPNLIVQMGEIDDLSGIRTGSIYALPNPDLRWEKTRSYNIGLDALEKRLGSAGLREAAHLLTNDSIDDLRRYFSGKVVTDQVSFQDDIELPLYNRVELNQLSKGEKQVFILSLYWAIIKTSNQVVPFIIDTPFARIDTEHREQISAVFFPNISGQVIILSTDEEVVGSYREIIQSHIAHEYLLEYNVEQGCTSVKPGYFKETKV